MWIFHCKKEMTNFPKVNIFWERKPWISKLKKVSAKNYGRMVNFLTKKWPNSRNETKKKRKFESDQKYPIKKQSLFQFATQNPIFTFFF